MASTIRKFFTQSTTDVAQALNGMVFAGDVVTTDISAAWKAVEPGYILRIYVTADTYIAFSDDDLGVGVTVSVTTSPAAILKANNHYHVIVSGNFVRTSSNPSRVEIIQL